MLIVFSIHISLFGSLELSELALACAQSFLVVPHQFFVLNLFLILSYFILYFFLCPQHIVTYPSPSPFKHLYFVFSHLSFHLSLWYNTFNAYLLSDCLLPHSAPFIVYIPFQRHIFSSCTPLYSLEDTSRMRNLHLTLILLLWADLDRYTVNTSSYVRIVTSLY